MTRVPAHLAGKQGPCPGCKKVIEVPRPKERKKTEAKPPPAIPGADAATGTVSAPPTGAKEPAGAGNDPLAILRQLPPGLIAGLLLAVVVPILGLAICIYYARSSPPGTLPQRWGRTGMRLSLVAVVMFFLAGQWFAAQRRQRQPAPGAVRAPPSSPGKLR